MLIRQFRPPSDPRFAHMLRSFFLPSCSLQSSIRLQSRELKIRVEIFLTRLLDITKIEKGRKLNLPKSLTQEEDIRWKPRTSNTLWF
ncbi:hypothetical protein KC19_4G201200 [Ceratodon purpureus]|uniref:Uncharacterized protein n=1 Tax=Ceratodon purpureus TaxID=3225 RepID=A0A8T0IEB7_CERPU|nr:hypothetical protein KC19_4G201200 [Ceratodon purpureus]